MSNFNFKRLIKKYSKVPVYKLIETEGYSDVNNGGIWVDGRIEEILIPNAAVVPLSNEDLKFGEGGTYTVEDRKLYCYEDIGKGTKVKHKDKSYTVIERRDYEDFDIGIFIYFVKRGGRD